MKKNLTDKTWTERSQREQGAAAVKAKSANTGKWLEQLLEREDRLQEEGNAYGEVYASRQLAVAVSPIFQRELVRSKILEVTAERGLTLVEIAELLEQPPIDLMAHVVTLRRRGQLKMERVEDETTPVYRAVAIVEES